MRRRHRKTVAKKNLRQSPVVKKIMTHMVLKMMQKTISHATMIAVRSVLPATLSLKVLLPKVIYGIFLYFQIFKKFSFSMLIHLFQTV